jgi:soluble lytic murein transglycosylase-like protein
MGLRSAFAVVILFCPAAAHADPVDRWAIEIAEASARFGIPPDWIRRVMRVESGGETVLRGAPIVSRAGAMGLMQLMPATWRDMRALLGLGANPYDPRDNIRAGTFYLRLMYDRFGYPGLFAAYNAGPARYSAFLSGARALPAETRSYAAAIAPARHERPIVGRRSPPGIFALAASAQPAARAAARSLGTGVDGLFVRLSSAARP